MSLSIFYVIRPASASGPSSNRVLNYQIRLTDPAGIPVIDGTRNIMISFYDDPTGGVRLHTDCGTLGTPLARKVIFTNGIGTVLIGDVSADASHNCSSGAAPNAIPATLFNSAALYLGITVDADAEMTPRKRVVATGYSINADMLDDLETSAVGGTVAFVPVTDSSGNLTLSKDLTVDGSTMYVDSTNDSVGINTTLTGLGAKLHVGGEIWSIQNGTNNRFVLGDTTGIFGGLRWDSATDTLGLVHSGFGSSATPILSVNSAGNVGIGTTGPMAKLHVSGGVIKAGLSSSNSEGVLILGDGTRTSNYVGLFRSTVISGGSNAYLTAGGEHGIIFTAQNGAVLGAQAERMRIDGTTGNVGIGTTTPITQLHVPGKVPTAATGTVATGANPRAVHVQGRYAYVANSGSNSMQIFDVSNPASPILLSTIASGTTPHQVYVQGKYAYIVNSASNTLQIYDVSNPAAPTSVGTVATGADPRSVYVQGRYAYVANTGSSSLQIFDVSNPASPVSVGTVATGTAPRYVQVQGRYAYMANFSASTMQIIDVSNPAAPVSVGSAATGGGPQSLFVQGRYAYVANYNVDTFQVFDVSNPAAPVSVGSVAAGTDPWSVYVQGRYAYVTTDVGFTLQVFDVSNPAAPVSVGSVGTSNTPRFVYVQGRYAYVVGFVTNSLRIFDVGGSYIQQFEAGGIETGSLAVRNSVHAMDAAFSGGVTVGQSLNVSGTLTVGGSGHLLPAIDDTYDLGSTAARWRDLYLGPTSLHIASTAAETTTARDWKLSIQETNGASEGNLRILEGVSELVNITPAGNVGIGNVLPSEKLEVTGFIKTTNGGLGTLTIGNDGSNNSFMNSAFNFSVNNGQMYLNTGGQIGFGTLMTVGTLGRVTINGTTNDSSANGLVVRSNNNTDHLVVRNDGNVGIGTAAPSKTLEVVGNIKMNGGTGGTSLYHNDASAGADWEFLRVAPPGGVSPSNLTLSAQRVLSLTSAPSFGGSIGSDSSGALSWDAFNQYSLTAQTPARIPLSIIGSSGQSAHLFNVTANGGLDGGLVNIDAVGNLGIGVPNPNGKLQVQGAAVAGTGTLTTSGTTTVTGTGTTFTTQLKIGDSIFASGQVRRITAIASTTSLTVDTAFSPNLSASSFTFTRPRLFVQESGSVGIGTTTPSRTLDIAAAFGGAYGFTSGSIVTADSGIGEASLGYQFTKTSTTFGNISGFLRGSTNSGGSFNGMEVGTNSAFPLRFITNSLCTGVGGACPENERMRISTRGDVGIGSTTKFSRLTVTPEADTTNLGGTTTANASTTITGVSTAFLTSLGIGDRISLSSAPSSYATVTTITSNTSLTVDVALGNGTSQTINKKQSIFRLNDALAATKLVVNDLGNVGIGTTSPTEMLHIESSATQAALTLKSTAAAGHAKVNLDRVTANTEAVINYRTAGTQSWRLGLANNTTNDFRLLHDSSAESAIYVTDAARNVGIGVEKPASKFQVQGTTTAGTGTLTTSGTTTVTGTGTAFTTELLVGDTIVAGGQARRITTISSATSLTVEQVYSPELAGDSFTYSRPRLVVQAAGNVGIGTPSPTKKLEIAYGTALDGGYGTTTGPIVTGDTAIFEGSLGYQFAKASSTYGNVIGAMRGVVTSGAGYVGMELGTTSNFPLRFVTNNQGNIAPNERMRIEADGDVGIGLASRFSRFTVMPAADTANIGGSTSANGSTTINAIFATGANFLVSLGVGDRVSLSSAPTTYATVTAITAFDSFTVDSPLGNGTVQTINKKQSILRLDDAASSTKLVVNDLGNVGIGTAAPGTKLDIRGSSDAVHLNVRANATQNAHIQTWENSGGTALSAIDAGGKVRIPFGTGSSPGISFITDDGTGMFREGGGVLGFSAGNNVSLIVRSDRTIRVGQNITSPTLGGTIDLQTPTAGTKGIVIKGSSVQTADLVDIQDNTGAALLRVNPLGDISAGFVVMDGTTTANGSGSSSTTLILTSAANFDIGNYVKVDSTDCVSGVNTCYAKITNIVSNTLTVSPAISWANASVVTEMHVPEIGGTDLTQPLVNRYGRGYFIDGIVTGNGSTYVTDGRIESSGILQINTANNQPVQTGTGAFTVNGQLLTAAGANANFDSGTLFVGATNDRVGIGTSSPGAKLDVSGGTLTAAAPAFQVTGTLPDAAQNGVNIEITSAGTTGGQRAFLAQLLPGFTGSGRTVAFEVANSAAGTGTDIYNLNANFGFAGSAIANTSGSNAGAFANAEGGDINVGFFGRATFAKNNAQNVGVMGLARNTGSSPIELGGYFGLNTGNPSFASAALIADNAATASPIFLARDNGAAVFSIVDGGNVGIGTTSPGTFDSEKLAVVNTSSGAGTVALNLINNANAPSTAVALDFTPNTNVPLAKINALRTDAGGAGTTDFALSNFRGSTATLTETLRVKGDTGDVGIRTSGPGSTLHILTANSSTDGLTIERSGFSTLGRLQISQNVDTTDTLSVVLGGTFLFDFGADGDFEVKNGNIMTDLTQTATTNGVCHSGANSDTTASDRFLVVCSGAPGDIAEWYETDDAQPGDIVVPTDRTITYESEKVDALTGEILPEKETLEAAVFARSAATYQGGLFGVVSSSPVQTIGKALIASAAHPQPIALAGRVKVRVTGENGAIRPGDPITSSSTSGAGMKATGPGMVVGFSLGIHEGTEEGTVLLYVNPGWWNGSEVQGGSELTATDSDLDMKRFGIVEIGFLRGVGDLWSIDETGRLTAKDISADTITAKNFTVRKTDERKTIGEATIISGEAYVQVHDAAITPSSKVFITFRKNPRTFWWIDEVMEGLFIVKTDAPMMEDTVFDYWIVSVADETTPVVDETTSVVEEPPSEEPAPEPQPEPAPVVELVPEPTPAPEPSEEGAPE